MTLLNSAALIAAAAVIVPILVHLQKRRKSRVVDWPAMQFLTRTVAARRRGLLLEHLMLLFLRCLIVLLFVLAMARPAIESGRHFSMTIIFFVAGCGLFLLTWAIVSKGQGRSRLAAVVVAILLFMGCGALFSVGPEALADSPPDRDVAIVIDSSLTMTLGEDGTSHFDRAISEAKEAVETLSGQSTASIVVAGSITEIVDGSPFRNLAAAEEVLGTLSPVTGGSNLAAAIQQATSLVKKAPNQRKQILLLTDDQLRNWESLEELQALSVSVEEAETNDVDGVVEPGTEPVPEITRAALVARLPKTTESVSVDRVLVDSPLVTAGRLVPIEVEIRNGGSTTVRDATVKLLIDDREIESESVIQIEPGVSSTAQFVHAFSNGGQHVVSGAVEVVDQLAADNRCDVIVDVIPHLSVLVVNGSSDADRAQQSATFARLALDPASLRQPQVGDEVGDVGDRNIGRPIVATAIDAARLDEIESFENFQLVMLCDVPRLPSDAAERVVDFVEEGGGLWIIPGEHTDVSFYNNWRSPLTEEPVLPAAIREWNRWGEDAAGENSLTRLGVAIDVAGRPFVSELFEHGGNDLANVSVRNFWRTKPIETAIVGMRLTNGEPLFTEHALGGGRVLMQTVSLAQRDSTLPANLGFPIQMHLWTYHLAGSQGVAANYEPSSDLVTELATPVDRAKNFERLELIEPGGTERDVPVSWEEDSPSAKVGRAIAPGVYQLRDKNTGSRVSSFVIQRDPEESDLSVASEDRLKEIGDGLGIEFIDDVSQLTAPTAVESAGTEIWDKLLFVVLWLLAAEYLVTMWIRSRRRVTTIESPSPDSLGDRLPAIPSLSTAAESPGLRTAVPARDSMSV